MSKSYWRHRCQSKAHLKSGALLQKAIPDVLIKRLSRHPCCQYTKLNSASVKCAIQDDTQLDLGSYASFQSQYYAQPQQQSTRFEKTVFIMMRKLSKKNYYVMHSKARSLGP